MPTTVIIGTDGSDQAIRAASAGLDLVRPADTVVIATVVDRVDLSLAHDVSGMAGPVATEDELVAQRTGLLDAGTEVVEHTREALGIEGAQTRVLEGRAGNALCDLAVELSAGAIIVGSRGRGGVRRALLGSVSDHVVRNATCPVVVTGDG